MARKEVVIKKRITNKLKQQLKKLEQEYDIKHKIMYKMSELLDKLDLLEYTHIDWRGQESRKYFWFSSEARIKLQCEYDVKKKQLLCVKINRIYRYGRKNGCWREETDKTKVKMNRRQASKLRQIMRIYEQASEAKN